VDIDIDPTPMLLDSATKRCGTDHVIGHFRFRDNPAREGHLVYAKTAVTGGAPWDVLAYAEHDPVFPYTSTAYQRFDERSFEAYRALGTYTAQRAAEALQHHLASWPHRRMPGAPEAVAAARTPGLGGQPAPGMAPAEPAAAGTSQGLNGEPAAGGSLSTP